MIRSTLPKFVSRCLQTRSFALVFCFFGSCELVAQEQKDPSTPGEVEETETAEFKEITDFVALVRNGFERKVEQADARHQAELDQLNASYLKQLGKVQRYFNESGNAEVALITRDEINRVKDGEELADPATGDKFDKFKQTRDRYLEARGRIDEAFHNEVAELVETGREALEKRASQLTRQGDLNRVEALTNLIPDWTGRPELVKEAIENTHSTKEFGDGDFLAGKRINYPHETKPDSIVSMVFHGDGKSTYVGLGGLEKPWSYKKGAAPDEYYFWMTGRPQNEDWMYRLMIHPGGKVGTVSKGPGYSVEAKIRN